MPDAHHPRHDIARLMAACHGVPFEQDPALVRQPAANGTHLPRRPAEDSAAHARLAEIIAVREAAGIPVANAPVATGEDGGRHKRVPGDQLGFRALVDPHGLLNPGKMPSYVPAIP